MAEPAAVTRDKVRQAYSKPTGTAGRARVDEYYQSIKDLGLTKYVAELDAYGYTVVPPELVAPPDFVERVRAALLQVARERTGIEHSVDRNGDPGKYVGQPQSPGQYLLYYLLFEDRVFEDWLENDTMMALVLYLMRGKAQLSILNSFIKWNGGNYDKTLGLKTLGLHGDSPPNPEDRLLVDFDSCNATLCLTDYTKEGGALAIVPGSHRLGRNPMPGEGVDQAVPVEAPAGSLIVWGGTQWHGAFPRTIDGLRLNLVTYFVHPALKPSEAYAGEISDEMLARHSNRFARLVGADDVKGWKADGPDFDRPTAYLKKTKR